MAVGLAKGGAETVKAIRDFLEENDIDHEYEEHTPVRTSEEASKVRGTKIEEGAKALVLVGKNSGKNYMIVLPAHLKADFTKVKMILGEKCELEKPELILERFGIKVGGVPPFGNLLGLETLVDKKLDRPGKVSFNCGLKTASIEMQARDLIKALKAKLTDLT